MKCKMNFYIVCSMSLVNNKTYYNLLLYGKNGLKLNSTFHVILKLHGAILENNKAFAKSNTQHFPEARINIGFPIKHTINVIDRVVFKINLSLKKD